MTEVRESRSSMAADTEKGDPHGEGESGTRQGTMGLPGAGPCFVFSLQD